MRMCPGLVSEYRMCNNHPDNCTIEATQVADAVSLIFPLVPTELVSFAQCYPVTFTRLSLL